MFVTAGSKTRSKAVCGHLELGLHQNLINRRGISNDYLLKLWILHHSSGSTGACDQPAGSADSLGPENNQRFVQKPLIEVSSSSWMATMEPCVCAAVQSKQITARKDGCLATACGWCLEQRYQPPHDVSEWDADLAWWETTSVCFELWTGGTAALMGSAKELVRLEGSHYNRLKQRRHALILWLVEQNTGPALSYLKREDIQFPIVPPIILSPPHSTL